MQQIALVLCIFTALLSCNQSNSPEPVTEKPIPLAGTWKLLNGTLIEKGDTTVTDYTKGVSFIKIINDSHFSFLQHDLSKGKDSAASYSSGGGTYTLKGNEYTEHLEYCSDRQWEGNDFHFTIRFSGDTLVQQGIEKIESAGVNRENIERYVRSK